MHADMMCVTSPNFLEDIRFSVSSSLAPKRYITHFCGRPISRTKTQFVEKIIRGQIVLHIYIYTRTRQKSLFVLQSYDCWWTSKVS
jgi:hypothetical protein